MACLRVMMYIKIKLDLRNLLIFLKKYFTYLLLGCIFFNSKINVEDGYSVVVLHKLSMLSISTTDVL